MTKLHQPTKLPAQVSNQPPVTEQLVDAPPPDQGGSVEGEVSVTTTVIITPPFITGAYYGKTDGQPAVTGIGSANSSGKSGAQNTLQVQLGGTGKKKRPTFGSEDRDSYWQ